MNGVEPGRLYVARYCVKSHLFYSWDFVQLKDYPTVQVGLKQASSGRKIVVLSGYRVIPLRIFV